MLAYYGDARIRLNVQFLDARFFRDADYRAEKIDASENPSFYKNIFTDGLLWDPLAEAFLIPASVKYRP